MMKLDQGEWEMPLKQSIVYQYVKKVQFLKKKLNMSAK